MSHSRPRIRPFRTPGARARRPPLPAPARSQGTGRPSSACRSPFLCMDGRSAWTRPRPGRPAGRTSASRIAGSRTRRPRACRNRHRLFGAPAILASTGRSSACTRRSRRSCPRTHPRRLPRSSLSTRGVDLPPRPSCLDRVIAGVGLGGLNGARPRGIGCTRGGANAANAARHPRFRACASLRGVQPPLGRRQRALAHLLHRRGSAGSGDLLPRLRRPRVQRLVVRAAA